MTRPLTTPPWSTPDAVDRYLARWAPTKRWAAYLALLAEREAGE